MMKKILFLIALTATCVWGCSRPKPIYHYVSTDIKNDFNFKPGTYWIMRDSLSGRVDSFFVTNNNDDFSSTRTGSYAFPAEFSENIRINISDYSTDAFHASDSQHWSYYFVSDNSTSDFVGFAYHSLPYFPYIDNRTVSYGFSYPKHDSFFLATKYDTTDTLEINNVFANYEINGNSFSKVAVIHQYSSYLRYDSGMYSHTYSHNDLFYVCPKIGIVKMRLYHPQDSIEQVWEILRYNIKM